MRKSQVRQGYCFEMLMKNLRKKNIDNFHCITAYCGLAHWCEKSNLNRTDRPERVLKRNALNKV